MQQRLVIAALAIGALAFSFGAAAASSGEIAAGAKKAVTCEACHGKDGNGAAPQFPALAGQYDNYLVQALHEYKDGQRKNAIMNAMAAPLTDQDINDLAAFFSNMPSKLSSLHGKIQGSHHEIFHNP
ncbi:MAG TPA: cytochrome c [Nevskiaceae bacterium]